jgi:hypothetical protein
MPDPFRELRDAQRKVEQIQNAPQREVAQQKSGMRSMANAPQSQARMQKSRLLNPFYRAKRQAAYYQGQARAVAPARQYKRHADRRTTTDFAVSALFYPTPLLAFFGGMVADWDTAFIRYHMINARLLWLVMILLFPLSPFIWMYSWYLGFRAYGGRKARIPVLTGFAEGRGWIDAQPR